MWMWMWMWMWIGCVLRRPSRLKPLLQGAASTAKFVGSSVGAASAATNGVERSRCRMRYRIDTSWNIAVLRMGRELRKQSRLKPLLQGRDGVSRDPVGMARPAAAAEAATAHACTRFVGGGPSPRPDHRLPCQRRPLTPPPAAPPRSGAGRRWTCCRARPPAGSANGRCRATASRRAGHAPDRARRCRSARANARPRPAAG